MLEHFYSRFHPIVCLFFVLAFASLYVLPLLGPWGLTWLMAVLGLVLADVALSVILRHRSKLKSPQAMQRGFSVIPVEQKSDEQ